MASRRALVALALLLSGLLTVTPAGAIRYDDPPTSPGDCTPFGETGSPERLQGRYIALIYIHQVERCPSQDDMAYWVARRSAGLTRLQLAESVDRSAESLDGILGELFDRAGLDRSPTVAERAAAHAELRAGRDVTRVAANVLASDEVLATYDKADDADDEEDPAVRDESWVGDMYGTLLGRKPDDAGVAYYLSTFGPDGSTVAQRGRVVTSLLRSGEFRRLFVQLAYTSIIGRAAGTEEAAYWEGWLRGTGRNRTLLLRSMVLASDEVYRPTQDPSTW
jgi:hypothetical protein